MNALNRNSLRHLIIIGISIIFPMILSIIHRAGSVSHRGHIQNLITFILILLLLGELLCCLFDHLRKAGPAAVLRSLFDSVIPAGTSIAGAHTPIGKGRLSSNEPGSNWSGKVTSRIPFALFFLILVSLFNIHTTYKFDKTTEPLAHTKARSIKSGSSLDQTIQDFEFEKLSAINIKFGTYARENEGTVTVDLLENGISVSSWTIMSSMLKDNAYQTFELESLVDLKEENEYIIHIEEEYDDGNDVAIWINGDEGDGYIINGEPRDQGTICYTLTYRNTAMRNRFIRNGILIGAGAFILILLGINETALMSLILACLMLAYSNICPPLMAPDEVNHFRRAYEVAEVGYVSEHMGETGVGGNVLPQALNEYISYYSDQLEKEDTTRADGTAKNKLTRDGTGENGESSQSGEENTESEKDIRNMPVIPINWDETVEMKYGNTALYSPISYIPQAIGIRIASVITDSTAAVFYAGRASNAIVSLLLCILALCTIPFGKRIVFLIMTFPLSLQEMISMSPDGFTISLSIFFLARILRLSYGVKKLRTSDLIVTGFSAIVLSQLKIVYVILLLMVLMIPLKKFKSPRQGIFFKAGLLTAAGLLNAIWLRISAGFLVEFNPGVDSPAQVAFVLRHPVRYYHIAAYTLLTRGNGWLAGMIGQVMGALNITTTGIVWIIGLLLFVYELLAFSEMKEKVHKWDPVILILIFLTGSALVFTSLYVQWTPLMNPVIEGIQGRYFTPLLGVFAFFIVFLRQKKAQQTGLYTDTAAKAENHSFYYLIVLFYNGLVLLDIIKYYIADIW